jgi:hypothetical protein
MRTIKYGGQLVPGDFVAIAFGNHIDFGWYCGDGSGTLQYYSFRYPKNSLERYEMWCKMSDEDKQKCWTNKQHQKGFTMKCLWKSYINSVHTTRVVKITNIEDIFTDREDREDYEKSREALITLNFIKQ